MVSLQKALTSAALSRRFLFFYLIVTFILLVSTGYYSYKIYETENLTTFNMEFEKVRNSVEKAETRFESYLKLLGKIISDSKNDRAKILQALRFDYLSISNNESPKIQNISFIPFDKTEAPITRLGAMNTPHKKN